MYISPMNTSSNVVRRQIALKNTLNFVDPSRRRTLKHGNVSGINHRQEVAHEDVSDKHQFAYLSILLLAHPCFNNTGSQSPEVSCRVNGQKLSFDHLLKVIVDPYVINGERLRNNVRALLMENEIDVPVYSRLYKDGESRTKIKLELADLLFDDLASISEIITNEENSDELREWARRIRKGRVSFFYNRFAKYLRDGTLSEFNNLT